MIEVIDVVGRRDPPGPMPEQSGGCFLQRIEVVRDTDGDRPVRSKEPADRPQDPQRIGHVFEHVHQDDRVNGRRRPSGCDVGLQRGAGHVAAHVGSHRDRFVDGSDRVRPIRPPSLRQRTRRARIRHRSQRVRPEAAVEPIHRGGQRGALSSATLARDLPRRRLRGGGQAPGSGDRRERDRRKRSGRTRRAHRSSASDRDGDTPIPDRRSRWLRDGLSASASSGCAIGSGSSVSSRAILRAHPVAPGGTTFCTTSRLMASQSGCASTTAKAWRQPKSSRPNAL